MGGWPMIHKISRLYQFGEFRFDGESRMLYRHGQMLSLTPKALEVLNVLVENAGRVIEKGEFLRRIWPDSFVEEANLSHQVYVLRKALGDGENGERFIRTVPRRGYCFVAPVIEMASHDKVEVRSATPSDLGPRIKPIPSGNGGVLSKIPPLSSQVSGESDETSSSAAETGGAIKECGQDLLEARKDHDPSIRVVASDFSFSTPKKFRQLRQLWIALVAILGAIVACFAFLFFRRDKPPDIDVYRGATFLTTYRGQECQPALSPDGKQVAFTWEGDGPTNWDIYVKIVATDSLLRLTLHPGQDTSPAWSPDGRFIAYRRNTGVGSGYYVVPALGGTERKIASAFPVRVQHRGRTLDWTPDGKSLVVTDRKSVAEPFALYRVDIETGEKIQLTFPQPPCTGAMGLAVSADGKEVAFSSVNANRTDHQRRFVDLYVVPISGGAVERLTFDDSMIDGVSWTPDGREIVYSSWRNARSNVAWSNTLWRIRRHGGEPQLVSDRLPRTHNPTISKSGRLAYEERDLHPLRVWRQDLSPSGESDGPARVIVSSTRGEAFPQISPDGEKIAFISKRTGPFEVWISDTEGSHAFPVTDFKNEDVGPPRWSPDSQRLVFSSAVAGTPKLYIADLSDRRTHQLTNGASAEGLPSWSRDGRRIYYSSIETGSPQIWKMPSSGGPAVQITQNGGEESLESPDGKFLYFTRPKGLSWTFSESSLWKVPVDGGEETLVVETIHLGHWGFMRDGIFYLDTSEREEVPFPIRFRSFHPGKTTIIGWLDFEPMWGGVAISLAPDARWMVFVGRDRIERDLMLVEGFH